MRRVQVEGRPGRLDAVLAAAAGISRADAQRAIESGLVSVDGRRRPKAHRLKGGERIVADLAEEGPPSPEAGGVPVHHQDEHLMVVAKPAGMLTHPTASRRSGTLVNRLLGMGVPLAPGDDPDRPGIVHRLDVGTSGLLVVAKTEEARSGLIDLLARREAHRTYQALVRGRVAHPEFSVEAPLEKRGARVVVRRGGGVEAETAFSVIETLTSATLLEARPRTGRTHQIRVHLSSIGHPILGDRAYGGGGDDATRLGLGRPFLHAWRLAFDHPVTGKRIEVEEPLPEDLREALGRARERA